MFSKSTTDIFRYLSISILSAGLVFVSTSSQAAITTIGGITTIQSLADVGDFFGHALAVSGDGLVLAVGAPYEDSNFIGFHAGDITWDNSAPDSGAVYVYTRSSLSTPWNLTGYVKAPNFLQARANALFGYAVSLSANGSVLAIGAPGENNGAGSFYVYNFRGSTVWERGACPGAKDRSCGAAIALSRDGDTLLIGAPNSNAGAGAAYKYRRSSDLKNNGPCYLCFINAPEYTSYLPEEVLQSWGVSYSGAHFGTSVALNDDGGTMAIGAPDAGYTVGYDVDLFDFYDHVGAVYVERNFWSNNTRGTIKQTLIAPTIASGMQFGFSVALPATTNTELAVGAPGESNWQGAVHVYRSKSGGSNWSYGEKIVAANYEAGDGFGYSVSFTADGNAIVVGAPFEDSLTSGINGDQFNNLAPDAGAAYIYRYLSIPRKWRLQDYLKASDTYTGDHYGGAVVVARDGLTIAVGAPIKGGNVRMLAAGGVYVY